MDSQKTVFNPPQQNIYGGYPQNVPSKNSKLPVIFLLVAIVILGAVLLWYFLIFNADAKLKISIVTEGNIEQKNKNFYEVLYKNPGNIVIGIDANKQPRKKEYFISVNGEKEKISFEQLNNSFVYKKKIVPNANTNSQFAVSLIDDNGKEIYNDNFNVSIIRPNMSSREYIENYLRTYSDAFTSQSSSRLFSATSYWESGKTDYIYDKVKKGFPKYVYFYFDNVISMQNDDISAKVYITNSGETSSTTTTYSYTFKLTVVKSSSGMPEWKIADAIERVEKRDTYNFGRNFEGD